MRYFKSTLVVKFPVEQLSGEEKEYLRSGWEEIRRALSEKNPAGAVTTLRVEEVEE